jgi:hypothetical protein
MVRFQYQMPTHDELVRGIARDYIETKPPSSMWRVPETAVGGIKQRLGRLPSF